MAQNGYFFTTVIGTHTHLDNVGKCFTELVRASNVPYFTMHGLRHTHATHLLSMGQNHRMVSARLGHPDIVFTL